MTLLSVQLPKLENIFYSVSWKHEVGSVNENFKASHWTSEQIKFMKTEEVILKKRKQNLKKIMCRSFFFKKK